MFKKIFFCFSIAFRLIASIFGWTLIVPLSMIIPKKRNWIGVFGREDGKFLDNAKFFFIKAGKFDKKIRVVFITERKDVVDIVRSFDREAYQYPALKSIWFMLRCGSFVVDEASWYKKFRFYLLFKAKIIQLWHGVPFKWIELGKWINESGSSAWASIKPFLKIRLFLYRVTGRRMCYACVVSTSKFYRDNTFVPFFEALYFPVLGYPRNDFARSLGKEGKRLAWSNVDAQIRNKIDSWQKLQKMVQLIAPTFRDSGSLPMQIDTNTLAFLDEVAEENNIVFVFKFHPSEKNISHLNGKNIFVCDRKSDIYPVMPYLSALLTDYSSISFDFLIVDRPLLFFISENDNYTTEDRGLQYDPADFMPGPVAKDWVDCVKKLCDELKNDNYSAKRNRMRELAFDNLDQSKSVHELIKLMYEKGWLVS